MRFFFLFVVSLWIAGCQTPGTGKASGKYDSIPDNYPLFPGCETYFSPEMQKWCFKRRFSAHLQKIMAQNPPDSVLVAAIPRDTLWFQMIVDTAGYVHADTLYPVDPAQYPACRDYFSRLLEEVPPMEPALEKGIPVAVRFKIPIVFKEKTF